MAHPSNGPLCLYCKSELMPAWYEIAGGVLCSRSREMIACLIEGGSDLQKRNQLFIDRRLEETTTPEERTLYCPVGRAHRPREGFYCQKCGAMIVKAVHSPG